MANGCAPRHSRRRFDCAAMPAGPPARCNAAASCDGITRRTVSERYLCICILSTGALRKRLRGRARDRGGASAFNLAVFALIAEAFGVCWRAGRNRDVVLCSPRLIAEFCAFIRRLRNFVNHPLSSSSARSAQEALRASAVLVDDRQKVRYSERRVRGKYIELCRLQKWLRSKSVSWVLPISVVQMERRFRLVARGLGVDAARIEQATPDLHACERIVRCKLSCGDHPMYALNVIESIKARGPRRRLWPSLEVQATRPILG